MMKMTRSAKRCPRRKSSGEKSPPTFPALVQEAEKLRDSAIEVLKRDGHHMPIVIAWTRDGTKEMIGMALKEDGPSMGTVLGAIVKTRRLTCFVSIAEAWMTRGQAASLDVMPSQSPEREQVLIVSAIHPEQKMMWVYPFASEGGRVVVGAMLDSTGMTLGGGIPNALDQEEDKR